MNLLDCLDSLVNDATENGSFSDTRYRVEDIRAALEALADVRTLDEWAGLSWTCSPSAEGRPAQCTLEDDCSTFEHFEGPTPDAARHAAAEWVRGQAR